MVCKRAMINTRLQNHSFHIFSWFRFNLIYVLAKIGGILIKSPRHHWNWFFSLMWRNCCWKLSLCEEVKDLLPWGIQRHRQPSLEMEPWQLSHVTYRKASLGGFQGCWEWVRGNVTLQKASEASLWPLKFFLLWGPK